MSLSLFQCHAIRIVLNCSFYGTMHWLDLSFMAKAHMKLVLFLRLHNVNVTVVLRCMQKQVKHNEITPSHIRVTKKASNFTEISAKYK